jgi:hypothetical protein
LACHLQIDADPDPVRDPNYHFDADLDPVFIFDADPDPDFLVDADADRVADPGDQNYGDPDSQHCSQPSIL